MNKITNIHKITDIFSEWIDFHDAEIVKVKYDGNNASIEIDCEGFIKTLSLFDKKYEQLKNVIVNINFKNVSHFEIDYDNGMNLIDKLIVEERCQKMIITIDSYYLKIICDYIEIDNVNVIKNKSAQLLDKYLKSNI